MNTAFAFVVGLLQAALSLLGFVQQHPELPQAQRDQAQQVAQQAIGQATQALDSEKSREIVTPNQNVDPSMDFGKYFTSAEGKIVFKDYKRMENVKYSDFSCGYYERKQNCTDNYLIFTTYQGYKVYQGGKTYSLIPGDFDTKNQTLNDLSGFDIGTFKLVQNIDKVIEGTDQVNKFQDTDPSKLSQNTPDDPYKSRVLIGTDKSAKYYFVVERFGCGGDSIGCLGSQYIVREGDANQSSVSVPGMSKYTDSDFGFSFWYPSGWQIYGGGNIGAESARTLYKDGVLLDRIRIEGDGHVLYIDKVHSDSRIFNVNPGACGYCGPLTYYFDPSLHTWMKVYPDGPNGAPGATPEQVAQYKQPKPADVSKNTMGGLHMFSTEQRENAVIIPLSARNFLLVMDVTYTQQCGPACGDGANVKGGAEFLAKTILATDPSVATPVSAAEQIKTIQAEKDAYAGQ